MATTTYQVARREFADYLGYGHLLGLDLSAWTTTANISTDALVISAELRDGGFDELAGVAASMDNALQGIWLYLIGAAAANVQQSRHVSLYDASAGQITVMGTNWAAESGAIDFELHKYHPIQLRNALNRARVNAFPQLHLPVTRTLFTALNQYRYDIPAALVGRPDRVYLYAGVPSPFANNLLSNPDFEDWTSGTPDSWSATTLDIAEETSTTSPKNYAVLESGSSARCTSQSGSIGTLLQNISSPGTHSGQRVSFSVWVYCMTAGKVRTQIDINAVNHTGTTADGGEHGGTGWELLTHFEDALVTVTTLRFGVQVDSDATDNTEFYVDKAIAVAGPLQEPETEPDILQGWTYREDVQGTTVRKEIVFPYQLPDNNLLRFEGKGYLSSVSAETDTFEIGAPQTDLLYAYAAVELFRRQLRFAVVGAREMVREQLRDAEEDVARYDFASMPQPRVQLAIPDWVR